MCLNKTDKGYYNLYDLVKDLKRESLSSRLLCFPHELLIDLWEKLFNKQIGDYDFKDNRYLWELSGLLMKIGFKKSNILLDQLENSNKDKIEEFYNILNEFLNIIKLNFLEGCFPFNLTVIESDNIETLKRKINNKCLEIQNFLIAEKIKINVENKKIYTSEINSEELKDIVKFCIKFILNDIDFLNQLLKLTQTKKDTLIKEARCYFDEQVQSVF